VATSIGINPVPGDVRVVSLNDDKRNRRIEVLTKDLKLVSSLDLDIYEYPYGMVFYSTGNSCIIDVSNIVKVSKDLKIVKKVNLPGTYTRITFANNFIVVSSIKSFEDLDRYYLTVHNTNLDVVDEFCLSCDYNYSVELTMSTMFVNNNVIYTVGTLKVGNRTKISEAIEVSNIYAVKLNFDHLSKIVLKTLPNLAQRSVDYTQLILIVTLIIVAVPGAIVVFLYRRSKRRRGLKKFKRRRKLHKLWYINFYFLLE